MKNKDAARGAFTVPDVTLMDGPSSGRRIVLGT